MAADGNKPDDFESTVRLNLADLEPYAKDEEPEIETLETSEDDAEMNFLDLQAELDAMDESLSDLGSDKTLGSSDPMIDTSDLSLESSAMDDPQHQETLVMDKPMIDEGLNLSAEEESPFSFQDFDASDNEPEVEALQGADEDFQLDHFFDEDPSLEIDQMLSPEVDPNAKGANEVDEHQATLVMQDLDSTIHSAQAVDDDLPILDIGGDVDEADIENTFSAVQEPALDDRLDPELDAQLDQELNFDAVNLGAGDDVSLVDESLGDEINADVSAFEEEKFESEKLDASQADEDFAAAYAIDNVIPELDTSGFKDSDAAMLIEEMAVEDMPDEARAGETFTDEINTDKTQPSEVISDAESAKQIELPVDESADERASDEMVDHLLRDASASAATAATAAAVAVHDKPIGDSPMPNKEQSKAKKTEANANQSKKPQIMVAAALAGGLALGGAGAWLAMSAQAQVGELQALLQASQGKVAQLEDELAIEKSRVVADAPDLAFKDETKPEVAVEAKPAPVKETPTVAEIEAEKVPTPEVAPAKVEEVAKPVAAVVKPVVKPITPLTPVVGDNEAWVVNVSSEPTLAGAENMQKTLADADIKSVITKANINGRDWYRVQLTGFDSRAAAKVYIETLELELGYKGMWVGH